MAEKKNLWENPWLYVVVIAVIVSLFLFWPEGQGEYDTFAQCVTDAGAIMYGTEWCPHCKDQKAAFGKSFDKVNYIDCDANKEACNSAFITGYPTWIIGGQKYSGNQALVTLASLTDCELVKDSV